MGEMVVVGWVTEGVVNGWGFDRNWGRCGLVCAVVVVLERGGVDSYCE